MATEHAALSPFDLPAVKTQTPSSATEMAASISTSPDVNRASDTDQPFRLFDLPMELVTHIANLALQNHDTIVLVPATLTLPLAAQTLAQPPITRTCRLLRDETLQPFYATREVHFETHPILLLHLRALDLFHRLHRLLAARMAGRQQGVLVLGPSGLPERDFDAIDGL